MHQPVLPTWYIILFYVLFVWSLVWKAIALWRSAVLGQKIWFIVIFILSPPIILTLGIIEIIYLFRFAKERMTVGDIIEWFQKTFVMKKESKKPSK